MPERAAPVLASTPYETAPFPVPDVPAVTVIQAALLAAVQAQPVPVVIVTEPEFAPAETATLDEPRLYVQVEIPDPWLITNVSLPTVMPPERGTPEFACTEYDTWPEPLPLGLPEIEIQGTALVAVHEHPG